MDDVFKALSDSYRRSILDSLRQKDGQSLSEIESQFPKITRFGVMKHLNVLEAANLVVTVKSGRHKYHYLNPVPIHDLSTRWISEFASPWMTTMHAIKAKTERTTTMTPPKHVYVSIIKTSPKLLWDALTDGALTPHYYYGASFKSTLRVGDTYQYVAPSGDYHFVSGTILEVIPERKLTATFKGAWMPEMSEDPESKVTWEIEPIGDLCKLTLIHHGFTSETTTYTATGGGWPGILSGLKTFLETGTPLDYNPMRASTA